ncbi:MAG: DUF5828 family protein [Haloarculaceae archaeon]
MEESVSGFKVRGDWADVVEHGERISLALYEERVDAEPFEEWNDWRPKAHERLSTDVSEKTADQVSVGEGEGEKAGTGPDEDLQTAGEKLSESYEHLEDEDTRSAFQKWQDSLDHVARAADTAGRKALRRVEDTVYQKVMTQFTPYYFDNELVSANLSKTRDGDYVFEVNINDDDLKDAVSQNLEKYEDVARWHVDSEKDTTAAEAAEGAETPVEREGRSFEQEESEVTPEAGTIDGGEADADEDPDGG